eukprot:SAG11_NODE_642_length_8006_cov_6.996965_8_plen_64_part_00
MLVGGFSLPSPVGNPSVPDAVRARIPPEDVGLIAAHRCAWAVCYSPRAASTFTNDLFLYWAGS